MDNVRAAQIFSRILNAQLKLFTVIFPYRYFGIPCFFHDSGLFFSNSMIFPGLENARFSMILHDAGNPVSTAMAL